MSWVLGENKMLKKCMKYIVVCLAVCCAFLLGIQWKSREMKELLTIIEEQKAEMAGCNQEKDEMSSEIEKLLEEAKEKKMLIVDDDMMVLEADGVYFRMERVEHMQDYEAMETFQDYYW